MAIELVVTPTGLQLCFTGIDRAAAVRRALHVPFERIVGSRAMSRADAVASSPRLPSPGLWWPGRLRAGCWGIGERRQLWAIRGGDDVVVVYLSGHPFHRLVVEAADCRGTQRSVEAALLHSKRAAARASMRAVLANQDDEQMKAPFDR